MLEMGNKTLHNTNKGTYTIIMHHTGQHIMQDLCIFTWYQGKHTQWSLAFSVMLTLKAGGLQTTLGKQHISG